MTHESIQYTILATAVVAATLATAVHVLLNSEDDTERSALWLIILAAFPALGIVLYLFCGISRRNTLGARVVESLRRISHAGQTRLSEVFSCYSRNLAPYLASGRDNPLYAMLDKLFPEHPPLNGCGAELFCGGDAAYPAMLAAIREARSSIHMQSFIFANDEIGKTILNALKQKAAEGVEVRVIYDSFGSFSAMFSRFFQRYSAPGFQLHAFSHTTLFTPWRMQLRNHRKLLVVDGKTAFLGGLNISAENFTFAHRKSAIHDLHCKLTGPAVSELQLNFLKDWCIASKSPPERIFLPKYLPKPLARGSNTVRVVPSGHGFCFEGAERCFMTCAFAAKRSIWICTPYFLPHASFLKVLHLAALRGVDVRILLPRNNNHIFMKLASRSLYAPLLADGVRIFERLGTFSHAKAMLIDGETAYFGSSNCDIRSFRLNYELDLLFTSGDFPVKLYEQLSDDFSRSVEISLEQTARTSLPLRLAQSVCALFTPIL